MNLIIDIGNTASKLAIFKDEELIELIRCEHAETNSKVKQLLNSFQIHAAIVSCVGRSDILNEPLLKKLKKVIYLDNKIPVPFKNDYQTPLTLGVDRIALVSAAAMQFPKENVLVLDAGTCVTYDFLNKKNEYKGGAISPGIAIRFKALHQYTANLPLLKIDSYALIGENTEASIRSGVLNGMVQEMNGVMEQYHQKYPNLTVVLTGGDTNFLAKKLKNTIFATPNFLLEGLNSILIYNLDE